MSRLLIMSEWLRGASCGRCLWVFGMRAADVVMNSYLEGYSGACVGV